MFRIIRHPFITLRLRRTVDSIRFPGRRCLSWRAAPVVKTMNGAGVLLGLTIGACSLKTLKASEASSASFTHQVQQKLSQKELKNVLDTVDRLYDANKMEEGLAYLEKYSVTDNAEVLWRLARLCYKVGKFHTAPSDQAKMAEKAVDYGERALVADDQNFACHKWLGIIISWSSGFHSTKRKIERSFDVQEHFLRAVELNPEDATSRHLLGQWCYGVSNVPWYQKKIATVVFATPPYSTYEEALSHFQAAEKLDPGFYSTNWLYIGKCYLQLGKVEEGSVWLKKAAAYQSDVEEDKEAKREAEELLKKLGISHD